MLWETKSYPKLFRFHQSQHDQLLANQRQCRCLSEGKIWKFRCGCDFAWLKLFSTQQLPGIFTIIFFGVYVLLREMSFVFPHFIMAATPHVKWDIGSGRQNTIGSCVILGILFKNYFKGEKKWWVFAQLYKHFTDCFALQVSTVDTVTRFQKRICIASHQKENKVLYILANDEMGTATVDSQ